MTRLVLTAAAFLIVTAVAPRRAHAQDVVDLDKSPAIASTALAADPQEARPAAIEYSEGHETRAKIHKYASWATLPLLGTEFWLGQKLYDDPNSSTSNLRGVHGAIGAGLIGFFSVQSVTGAWNLLEARHAPGHKKRLVHGLIMLAAEGGLVAAAATAPGGRNDINPVASRSTHRNIAVVSIGVGTGGYLFMLLTGGSH